MKCTILDTAHGSVWLDGDRVRVAVYQVARDDAGVRLGYRVVCEHRHADYLARVTEQVARSLFGYRSLPKLGDDDRVAIVLRCAAEFLPDLQYDACPKCADLRRDEV